MHTFAIYIHTHSIKYNFTWLDQMYTMDHLGTLSHLVHDISQYFNIRQSHQLMDAVHKRSDILDTG